MSESSSDKSRKPIVTPGTMFRAEPINTAFWELWDAVEKLQREVESLKAQLRQEGGQGVESSH